MYEPTASASEVLNQERGAFVTLRKSGELRGCVGYTFCGEASIHGRAGHGHAGRPA